MNTGGYGIISPTPRGSGAMVLHRMIEGGLPGYRVIPYSPWLTLLPWMLAKLTAGVPCRLIHTTPDYGLFFHRPKVPLVLTIFHYMGDRAMRPYSSFLQQIHYATDLKWFIRKSIERSTVLTSISRYSARHTRDELGLNRNVRVIYCGIDEQRFRPSREKQHRRSVRVLFSGNLTLRKGAQWLAAIAAGLDPGIIVQFTSGLRRAQFRPCGSNLTHVGRVAWRDMPELYRSNDILVSPTVREGFGLAIAEAMACGLPVVASNCSSVPELVDDGKGGFLCPVGDVAAFAEKINLLAQAPDLRRRMGEYNRAKVEKLFTLERMITEYRELFQALV